MKQFVPHANSLKKGLEVLESVGYYLKDRGLIVKNNKAYSISYEHEETGYTATVGERTNINDELVIGILESDTQYFVCTLLRGVAGGLPLIVAKSLVTSSIYFD